MTEKVGKVTLDDTYYPGEDLYCDGATEDELLEIVKEYGEASFGEIIEEKKSWPILYHLSGLRENIVDWIPLKGTDKVLEVGSGCGAITGALARKAGSVTCVDLSKKRSMINAYRHSQADNITIYLGNFREIEPHLACDYDYIFLIGVFEYGQSYMGNERPYETFLGLMKRHLAKGGRLIIAIENRFGLKYWAGCREDHLGTYFDGIEGYPQGGSARTFTRRELEKLCDETGFEERSFYYPYPDYKFPICLYSDDRLPKVGELSVNLRNFDRDRLLLFDEKNVFDSLIREEMFPQFSNSYLLVLGPPLPETYVRFSNDRAPQYAIRTEIRKRKEGLEVRKIPMTPEARDHVARLEGTCHALEEIYEGHGLSINRCVMDSEEAVLEYLPGMTLEEMLDECLEKNDREEFRRLFDRYCELAEFSQTKKLCSYDMIFSNIILVGDTWNLIDYEWTSEEAVPAREMILRALYCYGLGGGKRRGICLELIQEMDAAKKEAAQNTNKKGDALWNEEFLWDIAEKEREFQRHSTQNHMSMAEIRDAIGNPVVPAAALQHRYMEEQHRNKVQIYLDEGAGFSEENSYFLPEKDRKDSSLEIRVEEGEKIKALRLDPAMDYCMVCVKSLKVRGKELPLTDKNIKTNGKRISKDTVVFGTQDPNITIENLDKRLRVREPGESWLLQARMEVSILPEGTAVALTEKQRFH